MQHHPAGTTLLSLELDGSLARVDLSAAYRSLSGISLALADYSIAMTLTQLREIAAVTITVRGQPAGLSGQTDLQRTGCAAFQQ